MSTFDVAVGAREALVEHGHEVIDYRLYRRFKLVQSGFEAFRPPGEEGYADNETLCDLSSEGLVHMALLHQPDWILIICGMGLHPSALLTCRRAGFRIACWFTEAPYNTNEDAELYLAQFCDIALVNERASVPDFQKVLDEQGPGRHAVYMGHGFRPQLHFPLEQEKDIDVLLVGTGFSERIVLLEGVDWSGINLQVLGFWPGVSPVSHLYPYIKGGIVPNHESVSLYRRSKIVLNPHRWSGIGQSANPRTFEVAACGAFQISDYRAEIHEIFGESIPLFEPGVSWELEIYIRRYLQRESEREELAQLSHTLSLPFTFSNRLQDLGTILSVTT